MTKDKNKEVAQTIMTAVNCFCDERKVAEQMLREHRTLQQTFTRVCVEWLKVLSEVGGSLYDDRNEASVRLAIDLMQIPEAKAILNRGLPLI